MLAYHTRLKNSRILLLETNKLKEDILLADFNETGFYTNQYSSTERKFWAFNNRIKQYIQYFKHSEVTKSYQLSDDVTWLGVKLEMYNRAYNELIYLYKLKGFKNYGLEGKMREYAHNIYKSDNKDIKLYCLMLRRHEKDFLLRKELSYVYQFNSVVDQFVNVIKTKNSLTEKEKKYYVGQLYLYSKYFRQLARIESRIGIKGKSGFLDQSKQMFEELALKIEQLDVKLKGNIELHQEKLKNDTLIIAIILVVILLSIIIILTINITSSVKDISRSFTNYINSGFNFDSVTYHKSRIREFNEISIGFLKMAKEINIFTNFFREKVHERTLAINQQKEEILEQQIKIENQYKVLLTKNTELSVQKQLLAKKNADTLESLRYAKRIQRAIQPREKQFKEFFNDSFVYYKPRDVVSGDFYLAYGNHATRAKESDKIIFLGADCTGHGVPGAIMSVLGINTIHKLIQEQRSTDPGFILDQLNTDLNHILVHGKEKDEIVSDGMEIAVFSFDKKTFILEYSIAKFSHMLIRNSELIELETNRSSIGYNFFEKEIKNFKTNQFQVKPGDCLYLFSDGYADQFGGTLNKKFKKSNIKNLVERIHSQDMKSQKNSFRSEFMNWKGNGKQIDDVLVIGIRF